MFANITPFKTAERQRKSATFKTATEKFYTTLTERFQAESTKIQAEMQEAIRTGKTRRDYRVPIARYNSVHWVRSYAEAKEEHDNLRWVIDNQEWETRVETDTGSIPVHAIMNRQVFLKRLGVFFGDHFTVSLQVHNIYSANKEYMAVEQTVYLNYWVDPVRTPEPLSAPPSPIPVYRLEDGVIVCLCHGEVDRH